MPPSIARTALQLRDTQMWPQGERAGPASDYRSTTGSFGSAHALPPAAYFPEWPCFGSFVENGVIIGSMSINTDLRCAVEALRRMRTCSDEQVYFELVHKGVQRRIAARAVVFLPMVYCRELLGGSGVRFADTFTRLLPGAEMSPLFNLNADPVWNAAIQLVRSEIESGLDPASLEVVATRSAEYKVAQELLFKGSELANTAFTPPVLTWPEDGPPVHTEVERPWWRIW